MYLLKGYYSIDLRIKHEDWDSLSDKEKLDKINENIEKNEAYRISIETCHCTEEVN